MSPSPKQRLRALLLALLLAFGMSVSLVQASLMAAEMAFSAETAQPCPHGCNGCGDDGDRDAGTCLSVCASAAQGLLPGEPAAVSAASRASFELGHLVLRGPSYSPEPGPPKTLTLA
jgi:hypothetical protein